MEPIISQEFCFVGITYNMIYNKMFIIWLHVHLIPRSTSQNLSTNVFVSTNITQTSFPFRSLLTRHLWLPASSESRAYSLGRNRDAVLPYMQLQWRRHEILQDYSLNEYLIMQTTNFVPFQIHLYRSQQFIYFYSGQRNAKVTNSSRKRMHFTKNISETLLLLLMKERKEQKRK